MATRGNPFFSKPTPRSRPQSPIFRGTLEILQAIRRTAPATRALIVTGDAHDRIVRARALSLGAETVLEKPHFDDALVEAIHGPIRAWDR